ncbi:MAG: tRNA pseudouridine(13) synthase TruD, partial [Candidatus Thorarchaeota archaeon]
IWNCAISKRMEMYGNLLPQDIDIIENGEMILPIIGNITEKYDNYLFDYMNELLEKDGLSKANFELKNVKGLKFPGRTRNIVIKPENLKVSMKEINDGEDIVLLEFSLNSGSYATIVLREFMKTSPINY